MAPSSIGKPPYLSGTGPGGAERADAQADEDGVESVSP